jgi:hypothetical protein
MAQLASHPEEEVRRAIEILATTDDRVIEKQVRAVTDRGVRFLNKVRVLEENVTLHDLENALAGLRSVVDPATARAAQATENVWREVADDYGLLRSGEVGEILGASKSNREFVSNRRNRGELLGVVRNNGYLFPGFQFDRSTGSIRLWVKPLLELAAESNQGAADVLFWMMSPTTYFNGDRPADHVEDGDRLVGVARRAWSVEW